MSAKQPEPVPTPEELEAWASSHRKEQMFNQKVTYEKQCALCKVGSGLFFAGFGAFH